MTLRTKKRFLVLIALTCCGAAVCALYWGFSQSPRHDENLHRSEAQSRTVDAQKSSATERKLAVTDFAPYWDRVFRRPLYDPPPPPPKPVEKKSLPPLRAKLVATMIEPGNSTAMLQLGNGEIVFRKVGEAVSPDEGPAEIANIAPGAVTVRRGEEQTKLSIE